MIPSYERPTAPIDGQFAEAPATQTEHIAADIAWRDFVAEDALRRLTEQALKNNRDFRIAVLEVAQSQAQYRITRAAALPLIDATAEFSRQRSLEYAPRPESLRVMQPSI